MTPPVHAHPEGPIRVVVPYTPGGVAHTVARLLMDELAERLRDPIVIDNQPGANGQTGSAAVARSAPDGRTLLIVLAAHAINPSLYRRMDYSPLHDLIGVSLLGHIPLLLACSAGLPAADLGEFVAWARANPASARFASSGIGSGAHLAAELFAQTAGTPMIHVPYKGVAPALPDLFAARVAAVFDSVQILMPHVNAGKLRALAMTSAERWPTAPGVPTMREAGLPSMTTGSWIGLLAPAGTPRDIVERLSDAMHSVLHTPGVHERLISCGIEPAGGTPEQFDAFIRSEALRWSEVIEKAGLRPENTP